MELKTFDGSMLEVHVWDEVDSPRGIVQIVHGMAEHAGRYADFAHFLNMHGFIVVADDHRGHGKSAKTLGYAEGDMFEDVVRDEAAVCDYFRARYGLPCILTGFSFGSFVVQRFLALYGEKIAAAVLAGSSHKKDFEVYLGSLVSGMGCLFAPEKPAKLIEKLSFGAYMKKFDDRMWLSADAENNAAYYADPLCAFTCSNRFYHDFFRGLRRLYTKRYIAALPKKLPLLLIAGALDPVGNQGKGMEKLFTFYKRAGMEEVSLTLFEGSRHEFLNEKEDRDRKWGTLLDFYEGHTPPIN